jgi:hypothetical protein
MGLADDAKKAEQLAEEHPQQVDDAVQQGEKLAEQHTGHRDDKQIGEAGEQIEQRIGGAQADGAGGGQGSGSRRRTVGRARRDPKPDRRSECGRKRIEQHGGRP